MDGLLIGLAGLLSAVLILSIMGRRLRNTPALPTKQEGVSRRTFLRTIAHGVAVATAAAGGLLPGGLGRQLEQIAYRFDEYAGFMQAAFPLIRRVWPHQYWNEIQVTMPKSTGEKLFTLDYMFEDGYERPEDAT